MTPPQSEQNPDTPSERPGSPKGVFVAIPSGKKFKSIYRDLINEPLENAGFRVTRAQDLSSARNILQDIIQGIERADVVVADLTGLNPNVFYEVGVAHALQKPVILLTQDIDKLPFDLQQYRTIPYSTKFDKAQRLADELTHLASRVAENTSLASGPFSDFGMSQHEAILTKRHQSPRPSQATRRTTLRTWGSSTMRSALKRRSWVPYRSLRRWAAS